MGPFSYTVSSSSGDILIDELYTTETNISFSDVLSDNYLLTFSDFNDCVFELIIPVGSPPEILTNVSIQETSCFSNGDGAVELEVYGEKKLTEQSGDGPVDSIFKCIKELYPHDVKLSLYQVHAVTEGTDAQATVSVKIEENDRTTVGQSADTDTLVASANAYLNALNKMLIKREKKSLYKNIEPKKLKESI